METEERSFSDESRFDHVRLKDARAMDVESKKIDLFKNFQKQAQASRQQTGKSTCPSQKPEA